MWFSDIQLFSKFVEISKYLFPGARDQFIKQLKYKIIHCEIIKKVFLVFKSCSNPLIIFPLFDNAYIYCQSIDSLMDAKLLLESLRDAIFENQIHGIWQLFKK